MKYLSIIIILLSILVYSCEEKVSVDLRQSKTHLVVEGLITDEDTCYYVKIMNTSAYSFRFSPYASEGESEALVIISNNFGLKDTLIEVSNGIYRSSGIRGEVGTSYQLEILTKNGGHYTTDYEEMLPVPKIDSFYYERDKNDKTSPYAYAITFYLDWQDPPGENNYYLWQYRYYWAEQWHESHEWKWVVSDKYFNGLYNTKYKLYTGYGGKDWYIYLNQYSLSKDAYDFWQVVQKLTEDSEGEFSNISAPLIGNVKNLKNPDDYVLGYFQVSSKRQMSLYIKE